MLMAKKLELIEQYVIIKLRLPQKSTLSVDSDGTYP